MPCDATESALHGVDATTKYSNLVGAFFFGRRFHDTFLFKLISLYVHSAVSTRTLPISSPYHDTPLQWYEYLAMILNTLLIPAIYGLFALFAQKRSKEDIKVERIFFGWAAALGLITSLLSYAFNRFSHVDCGDTCVNYIPSYTAINWMLLVSLAIAMIYPLVLAIKGRTKTVR